MNESCVYTLLGFGATRTATARVNRFTTLWICLHYAEARSVGTILGVPFGVALLVYVPGRVVAVVLGAVLALYGVYNLPPTAARKEVGLQWAYPAGLFAGALGSAYNFTGVPVVVYGTLRGWRPAVFRGTLQVHFVIAGILVVAAQALGGV